MLQCTISLLVIDIATSLCLFKDEKWMMGVAFVVLILSIIVLLVIRRKEALLSEDCYDGPFDDAVEEVASAERRDILSLHNEIIDFFYLMKGDLAEIRADIGDLRKDLVADMCKHENNEPNELPSPLFVDEPENFSLSEEDNYEDDESLLSGKFDLELDEYRKPEVSFEFTDISAPWNKSVSMAYAGLSYEDKYRLIFSTYNDEIRIIGYYPMDKSTVEDLLSYLNSGIRNEGFLKKMFGNDAEISVWNSGVEVDSEWLFDSYYASAEARKANGVRSDFGTFLRYMFRISQRIEGKKA